MSPPACRDSRCVFSEVTAEAAGRPSAARYATEPGQVFPNDKPAARRFAGVDLLEATSAPRDSRARGYGPQRRDEREDRIAPARVE